jgi:OOP family OmpA-OmpF porin
VTLKLIITGAVLAFIPAWGQSAGAQTSEQLACQLSGACVDAAPEKVVDQGTSNGEGAEVGDTKPRGRVSATRGFSIAKKAEPAKAVNGAAATKLSPQLKASVAIPKAKGLGVPGKGIKSTAVFKPSSIGRADLRVSFVSASAEMTAAGQGEAMKFVEALKLPLLNSMRFTIAGHTDAVGKREYNLDLSRRRAQAVVDYLVANGADRSRFEVQGFGFDRPVPGLAAGSAENRRVEVIRIK